MERGGSGPQQAEQAAPRVKSVVQQVCGLHLRHGRGSRRRSVLITARAGHLIGTAASTRPDSSPAGLLCGCRRTRRCTSWRSSAAFALSRRAVWPSEAPSRGAAYMQGSETYTAELVDESQHKWAEEGPQ